MTNADRPQFAHLLAALAAAFGREADEALAEGYWLGLADLEIHEVESACARALRESEFFPKPVELRRLAGHMAADMRSVLAWDSVATSVARIGHWTSVDFDDPLINATIRNMGGWTRLCTLPIEEFQVWGRKEFERIYAALCESGTSAESCAHLPGATEAHNSAKGYEVAAPRRVQTGLPPHKHNVTRMLEESDDVTRIVAALAAKKVAL